MGRDDSNAISMTSNSGIAVPVSIASPAAAGSAAGPAAGPAAGSVHAWARFEHCATAATLNLSYGSRGASAQQPSASSPPALRIVGVSEADGCD